MNPFTSIARIAGLAIVLVAASASASGNGGVFTLTNSPSGNAVAVYSRDATGGLHFENFVPTGGLGSGAGLGSQGALTLTDNGRWLLAVNAGSNDVSTFAVGPKGLKLVDRVASGGTLPISVTVHDSVVYVLNAGGAGNVSGFTLGQDGHLAAIGSSTKPLSGAGPAQVQFSPDGDLLVVSEKAANQFEVFNVDNQGMITGQIVQPSVGLTPFGFSFGKRGRLYVSEAFGGAVDGSAVSSYDSQDDGTLSVISPSVSTTETAACWIATTPDGKYVYAANAGSGSISGYRVDRDGSISLLDSDGRTGVVGAGSSVIDLGVSVNGRYLYVLARGFGSVYSFSINPDGSLTPLGHTDGTLGAATTGIAVW